MTDTLQEILERAVPQKQEGAVMDADDMCMDAERVVAVAEDMRAWADSSASEHTAVERFRALAVVRELANERWAEAARKMRTKIS